jgi:hypothetical protein
VVGQAFAPADGLAVERQWWRELEDTHGSGAGVVIASEVPGETVANTIVEGNQIWGNGLAGVTVHVHEPNQDFNGTQIKGNWIGQNNTLGDPIDLFASTAKNAKNFAVPDTRTIGILAATASSVTGTLIANNHISDNHFGGLRGRRSLSPRPG